MYEVKITTEAERWPVQNTQTHWSSSDMVQWHKVMAIFIPFVVEAVCTMFLVLLGCGSTITWPKEETGPTVVSISLCFGFSYAFLVNISTCFSGGFCNPAITMALVTNKTLSVTRAIFFISAQLFGGENISWTNPSRALDCFLKCIVNEVKLTSNSF